MPAHVGIGSSQNYLASLLTLVRLSFAQLVRTPSHSRRAEAARRLARHTLLITAMAGAAISFSCTGSMRERSA